MAEKIKLNKNTLREQNQALKLYQEFLPTLELRKQQLQMEVRTLRKRIREQEGRLAEELKGAQPYAPMLAATLKQVKALVVVEEVVCGRGNVAGVKVPVFEELRFSTVPYSLIATPPFFDAAVALWKSALSLRAELRVLHEQLEALQEQLTKTTQRINLYEKVLIPECKENIRKIKVYLGDQQTAAVCRAKIAKGKLEKIAAAEAAGAGG